MPVPFYRNAAKFWRKRNPTPGTNMKFIIIPLATWVISQTIKFGSVLLKKDRKEFETMFWTYMWAGGAPSTHSAMLTVTLSLLWHDRGFDAIFGFCLVVALLIMYNLADNYKQQLMIQRYFDQSNNPALKKISKDGLLLNLSGHTFLEIFSGVALGLVIALILAYASFI
ncbi:MAG: hypothetical protein G01um101429_647 [Parcubacteria group bacterium Gr01-1014_29]|nr:MAG: hypothetical protein G01um101429_647 [Parcubacteria group bacterium Gr01-1014_29]